MKREDRVDAFRESWLGLLAEKPLKIVHSNALSALPWLTGEEDPHAHLCLLLGMTAQAYEARWKAVRDLYSAGSSRAAQLAAYPSSKSWCALVEQRLVHYKLTAQLTGDSYNDIKAEI